MKSKNKLNSLYGMAVTNPLRRELEFKQNSETEWAENSEKSDEEILNAANKKSFLPYVWGVWVTAYAREALQIGIDVAGDGFVYADTDSVKFVGEADFSEFNRKCIDDCLENGSYADDKTGIRHYMGVYEYEGEYREFLTLGAKKYAYIDNNGRTHVTIAGVNKSIGGAELEKMGGLRALENIATDPLATLTFCAAGGNELRYNDSVFTNLIIDGHTLEVRRNVAIIQSTYTLGISNEYLRLLAEPEIIKNYFDIMAQKDVDKREFCDKIIV